MKMSYVIFFIVVVLFSAGCGKVIWKTEQMWRKTKLYVYEIEGKGETNLSSYYEVAKEYNCYNRGNMIISELTFDPVEVAPGEKAMNRFVYASCYQENQQGHIIRRVKQGDDIILEDIAPHEFKPGEWEVTAFLVIPPEAEPGKYAFEFEFKLDIGFNYKEQKYFEVLKTL